MANDPIPTTDHEWTAMVALLAGAVTWPFFHPFHSTAATVFYWSSVGLPAVLLGLAAVLRVAGGRADD